MGGGAPPAKSGGGPLKYILIGCGGLFLLSCLCGGGFYAWGAYKARQLQAEMGTVGTVPVDTTGTGTGPTAGGGSDNCTKAKACCMAIYSQPIFANSGGTQACTAVDQAQAIGGAMADTACGQQLAAFRQAAAALPGGVPADCN